jgi:putative DNA primase/helicase
VTFIDFARDHGVDIDPAKLCAGERIRRCGTTDKPRSANGAYFWDGQRGWVFNWSAEARVQWFSDQDATPWTEAEKQQWKARRQALRAQEDNRHHIAAMRAAELVRSTKPGPHDYLARKGFPDLDGMVDSAGDLIVPMRHLETNALLGAQVIHWDDPERKWVKKMLPGMKAKGAILRLGDKTASETFLVEGYATGLSVLAALRSVGLRAAVLVCFSANNLEFVAPQVKGRVFVFADNDKSGVGEAAAKNTGKPYCMSPIEGEDANDVHVRAGLMPVVELLMKARRHG